MEDELWEPLDPELWELTHNPWLVAHRFAFKRWARGCVNSFVESRRIREITIAIRYS